MSSSEAIRTEKTRQNRKIGSPISVQPELKENMARALRCGPLLAPRALWQQRRPLHDVVFEIGVGDFVLGSLHPPAHGDAGFMHRVGIARNQRMPPIEVAALGHEPVA